MEASSLGLLVFSQELIRWKVDARKLESQEKQSGVPAIMPELPQIFVSPFGRGGGVLFNWLTTDESTPVYE